MSHCAIITEPLHGPCGQAAELPRGGFHRACPGLIHSQPNQDCASRQFVAQCFSYPLGVTRELARCFFRLWTGGDGAPARCRLPALLGRVEGGLNCQDVKRLLRRDRRSRDGALLLLACCDLCNMPRPSFQPLSSRQRKISFRSDASASRVFCTTGP